MLFLFVCLFVCYVCEQEGRAPSKDKNECVIYYNGDSSSKEYWNFGKSEKNYQLVFEAFKQYAFQCYSQQLKSKKNMEIYFIENESDLDSDRKQIESSEDFGHVFEISPKMNYISPGGQDPNYFVRFCFNVKVELVIYFIYPCDTTFCCYCSLPKITKSKKPQKP